MKVTLSDRPIDVPEQDLLGRDPFAKNIAELIINAPPGGSLRIGVYGGWGEGKTSVLKLIRNHLKSKGQVCVWLTPWVFSNREEALEHLVREIASELGFNLKELDSATARARFGQRLRDFASADVKLKLADTLIGPAVQKYLRKKAEEQGQILLGAVEEKLGGERLIVFIDDLDRVTAEMVPDLLLTLREALDYPNFFYVMALAPQVVEHGLRMVHKGWGEHHKFLEKIIELPKYLPEPTPQERQRYANALIQSLGSNIDQDVLEDLAPLLPQNPRKLKLLLRYIASLHGVFNRFHASEIDWRALYICLMLRFEFPEETSGLVKNEQAVKDIEAALSHLFKDRALRDPDKLNELEKKLPEASYAPKDELEKIRFLSLCKALRERETFERGRYPLAQLFNLSEQPPALTFKEIENEVNRLTATKDSSRLPILGEWLTVDGQLDSKKTQAFVNGLVELREDYLNGIADSDMEEEVKEGLKIVSIITNILRLTTIDLGGFEEEALTPENWSTIYRHFARWSHFETFDYYKQVREDERQLLKDIVGTMSTGLRLQVLDSRELGLDDRFRSNSEAFQTVIEEIRLELERTASNYLIDCFESPNGIEAFWAIDFYSKGKNLLFTKSSSLHSDAVYRERLREISNRASRDREIQRNFLTYFRMLCYGALEGKGSFHTDKCKELLKDTDLLKIVWTAAVAQPLNPRMAGSLYRYHQKLLQAGVSSDLLPKPRWWERLAELGFFPTSQDQENR
jgi:hypothetical protein